MHNQHIASVLYLCIACKVSRFDYTSLGLLVDCISQVTIGGALPVLIGLLVGVHRRAVVWAV